MFRQVGKGEFCIYFHDEKQPKPLVLASLSLLTHNESVMHVIEEVQQNLALVKDTMAPVRVQWRSMDAMLELKLDPKIENELRDITKV